MLALVAFIALFARFLRHSFYGLFEDDFFYYALVAKHLVQQHLSTFDGTHLTNGYHPLWFLVVALCFALLPGIGFFLGVQAVAFAAILFLYFGTLRCLRFLGTPDALQRPAALLLSLHSLLLFRYGMEVTLAIPLAVWTLTLALAPGFRWTTRQTLLYGLCASLTVLARLDAILLIALLFGGQLLTMAAPLSVRMRRALIFAAGWVPLLAYLGINHHFFNSWLPVSGSAKQLKPLWPPDSIPFQSLFVPFDRMKAAFVYPAVLLSLAGASEFYLRRRHRTPERNALLAALFLFPVLHIATLCFLSDWTVWPWYYYSLCFPVLAAAAVLLEPAHSTRRIASLQLACTLLSAAFAFYIGVYAAFKHPTRPLLFFAADFERLHPGTYAMGDGSGTPSYFGGRPVVQLEGLVMDAAYIHLLRQHPPLRDVLDRYHVDYYITFGAIRTQTCRNLAEPAQAGPHSPRLYGRVCAPPLASTREGDLELDVYRASDVLLPQQP